MKNKEFDAGKLLQIALGASCILALAYLLIYLQGTDGFPEEATRLGQLGDFFGGILNPTVSVLTLFVAIGVWQLQKTELEDTREALKDQAKTAEQQRQEQRFFDLLNVYFRTVENTRYTHYTNPYLSKRTNEIYGEPHEKIFEGKAAISNWLSSRMSALSQHLKDRGSAIPG